MMFSIWLLALAHIAWPLHPDFNLPTVQQNSTTSEIIGLKRSIARQNRGSFAGIAVDYLKEKVCFMCRKAIFQRSLPLRFSGSETISSISEILNSH